MSHIPTQSDGRRPAHEQNEDVSRVYQAPLHRRVGTARGTAGKGSPFAIEVEADTGPS